MNNSKNLSNSLFIIALVAFALVAFKPVANYQEKWEVPAKYNSMENPMAGDEEAIEIGEELYVKHCNSCHGKTGLGDGKKAAELDTDSGDFTTAEFASQTDGALFYKTTSGRGDMPAFEKKIADEEERWMVVTYLRSFAK